MTDTVMHYILKNVPINSDVCIQETLTNAGRVKYPVNLLWEI